MRRRKRIFKQHGYYHVYNRGNRKNPIFIDTQDKIVFIKNLKIYTKRFNIELEGYCLMYNHYHLILKTKNNPQDLSKMMQAFTTKFCLYYNKKYGLVGHVFQGRYNAVYVAPNWNLERVKKYLKNNPVKEGLVKHPGDYRWLRIQEGQAPRKLNSPRLVQSGF
jgi:putative transposase